MDCGKNIEILPPPQKRRRFQCGIYSTINGAVWACAADTASQQPANRDVEFFSPSLRLQEHCRGTASGRCCLTGLFIQQEVVLNHRDKRQAGDPERGPHTGSDFFMPG